MTDDAVFRLRLPARLKAWLDSESNANGRSTNDEIVARLLESKHRDDTAGPSREVLAILLELKSMDRTDLAELLVKALHR